MTFKNNILKTVTVAVAGLACATAVSAYEPAGDNLMTRWGKEVTPENAWRSYPRPQLERSRWQNLNGLWSFSVTGADTQMKSVAFDREILVPFCIESSLSGVGETFASTDRLWYKKEFTVDSSWKGNNIILHFGAVDYSCEVYVDGRLAGRHVGGNNSFSFDITRLLKGSGTHTLVVAVTDPTDTDSVTRGKQVREPRGIWYTAVSGIWKTVWLEPVSPTHIERIRPSADIKAGKVTFDFSLSASRGDETVKVAVLDGTKVMAEAEGPAAKALTVAVPDAELWSTDSPKLYDVNVTLSRKGKMLDEAESYFAMREMSKVKDEAGYERIAINGEPVFQWGTLDQGWWPDGLLTPPSEEAMLWDMVQLKDMGFNTIRKHIKVEPELYYYYADSLGIMVWQDMVSGFCAERAKEEHVSAFSEKDWDAPQSVVDQWKYEYNEMVDQLRFYPSITTWVVFNEGWGQHNTPEMTAYAASLDGSRIINSVSGWADRKVGDLDDIHNYPSVSMVLPENTYGRIPVLGEFGGLSLPVAGHMWIEGAGWGYRKLDQGMDLMKDYSTLVYDLEPLVAQGLSAAIYTQTTDVEREVNGLITYDREVIKLPVRILRFMHDRLYKTPAVRPDVLVPATPAEKHIAVGAKDSAVSEKTFTVDKDYDHLSFWITTLGEVEVRINGEVVFSQMEKKTKSYNQYNLSDFAGLLRKGENSITVSVKNTTAKPATLDFFLRAY